MKTGLSIFGVMIGVVGVIFGATSDSSSQVTQETVKSFYQGYSKLTPRPYGVNAQLALLCTEPSPEMIEKLKDAHGPHYTNSIHLYANAVAAPVYKEAKKVLPVGSVIVKEKLDEQKAVTGIGGMIKRAPGFDPVNGDWEYFYYDDKVGFSQGKLANCAGCHAKTKETDFVFTRKVTLK
ncbi:MAG: cytochrome P460 family protein [Verrucomicrobiota bacterium]